MQYTTFSEIYHLFLNYIQDYTIRNLFRTNLEVADDMMRTFLVMAVTKFYNCVKDIKSLDNLKNKIESFNWNVIEIDGHNSTQIISAYIEAKNSDKPTAIIANTIKGKGVSFMENNAGWHGKAPNDEELKQALEELEV